MFGWVSPFRRGRSQGSKRPSPHRRSWGLRLLLAIGLAIAVGAILRPPGRQLAGEAFVIDGDTIRIGDATLRLKGMDAPEMRQSCERAGVSYPCGEVARSALVRLLHGRKPACRIVGRDRYGRGLARCSVEGKDIGRRMVEDGWAVAYGDYEQEEGSARARGAGLWSGSFDRPSLWRRERRP